MILDHFEWKMQIHYYILNIKQFCYMLEAMKQAGSFLTFWYNLFYELEPHLIFFYLLRKWCFSVECLKIIFRGYVIGFPQNLSMLIISSSWILLGSKSWTIFAISLLLNLVDDITLPVLSQNAKVSFLELMKGYCSTKTATYLYCFAI